MSFVELEVRSCLICLYGGTLIGLVYEALRLLRFLLGGGRLINAVMDALFYAGAGAIAALSLYYANGGAPRLYTLVCIGAGAALYMLGPGHLCSRLYKMRELSKSNKSLQK